MSNDPTEPVSPHPAKPSRWKRRLAWTAGIVLILIGVGAYSVKDYIRTLQSLRNVPGTNAYVMDYYLDYHIDEIRQRGMDIDHIQDSFIETLFPDVFASLAKGIKRRYLPDEVTVEPDADHCSTVAMRSNDGEVFFGRNFDWHHDACLILRVHDRQGVASLSVLDLKYINLDRTDLEKTTLVERVPLLFAPYYLMDGMNRYGVAVADMSVAADPPHEPGKPAIILSTLMRLMLDRAKTTDEAVAMVNEFNIHFVDTREHLMIADASGQFRVIEFIDGKTVVTKPDHSWQISTNHLLWQKSEAENDQACSRYQAGSEIAEKLGDTATFDDAVRVTKSMSVEGFTMWSSLYNLTTGDASIRYKGHDVEYRDKLKMIGGSAQP